MPVTEVKKTWSTTSFGCGEKRLWDADTERLRSFRHPHRALAAPASAPRITFCLKLGDGRVSAMFAHQSAHQSATGHGTGGGRGILPRLGIPTRATKVPTD